MAAARRVMRRRRAAPCGGVLPREQSAVRACGFQRGAEERERPEAQKVRGGAEFAELARLQEAPAAAAAAGH